MPRPSAVILMALAFALPARAQLDASQMAAARVKAAPGGRRFPALPPGRSICALRPRLGSLRVVAPGLMPTQMPADAGDSNGPLRTLRKNAGGERAHAVGRIGFDWRPA